VHFEVISSAEKFEQLGREWNTLLARSTTNEIFLTWQWQSTWWAAYHPGDLWVFTARDEDGQLIGIAPWFIEQPSGILRTIGCVDVTDYLDVLVVPEHREAFLSAAVDALASCRSSYTRISLCNIPDTSPTLQTLPRIFQDRGFSVEIEPQEVCPIIMLPGTFEDYLAWLDKKQRHECRRKLRRAEEAGGVEWYVVGSQHDLNAEIDRFIDLMAASHPDKAKFLEDPQHVAFFRAMIPKMAHCGWLQLIFLTVEGQPAAAYLNFDYGGRVLVYNSGLMPNTFSALSPGIVLLLHNIEYAISLGRTEFDFLRGNEDYKYRMGGQDRPVLLIKAQ
jgi:CelD/BcsL family acetyltransferase involved in cellulose biosynthesis